MDAHQLEVTGSAVPGMRLGTRAAVFGLAYFLAHEIAFLFPDANKVLMAVWPAGGIGLAALLLNPRRQWGVLLAVLFVAGNLANLTVGRPMLASVGFMTANVLESLGCAWLITQWCGGQVCFDRVRDVVALMLGATLVNAGSALLGATTAVVVAAGPFWKFYQAWGVAAGLGLLLVTPLIVAWCREWRGSLSLGRWWVAEFAVLALVGGGLSAFAFGPASALPNASIQPYTLVIVLCWAALRLGVRGTALVLMLIAGIAVGYTATGHSGFPLGGQDPTHRLLMVQLFLGVCAGFALLFAAGQVERSQTEAALRESQSVGHSLVEQLPAGVFRKDLEGRYLMVNPWFCRLKGMKAEEFLGKTSYDVAAAEKAKPAARAQEVKYAAEGGDHHRLILETGKPLEMVETYTNAQGQKQLLHIIKAPLLNPDGKIIGTHGILFDITERKQAEALKETLLSLATKLSGARTAKEAAHSIFAAADQLWQWESGGLHVLSADGATAKTVLAVDIVEGERRPVTASTNRVNCSPRMRRIMAHGAELLLRTPEEMKTSDSVLFGDTSRLSASLMIVPVHQHDQSIGFLSIQSYRHNAFTLADLQTLQGLADHCGGALERIKAEEQLREQAALLDAANDAIYVRQLDHTIIYWNAGAERLYGWPRAEALGHKMADLSGAASVGFAAAHAALLERGHWSGELTKTSKAGKPVIVFCRWTLLRDEQGQPTEVLAINTDITDKKQLETQFLRAQRMEGIGALAGGLAHDLNNILCPILMVAPLLFETATDPESRQMLNTVESCAQRGADIIKQLLTFARGQPGTRAPLPVRHLLNEMHKLIRETFPRNIRSGVRAPANLWLILGDATQIHQALMNLCVHARDALPEGGTLSLAAENVTLDETAAVLLPEGKPGDYVRVSVTDTGTGIPPEFMDRIFDPFFTSKEIGKGTGLGLPTVLGIVRGHGGFVRVRSQVGQGTTFELYLPATPETKATGLLDAKPLPPRGQGELILVVDDEVSVRDIMQRTLENGGYRAIVAREGTEALTLFGLHPGVKVVITDMMMPGMDGPKLVQALRQLNPQLPILGMTGLAGRAGVKGLDTLHLPVVLNKPFSGADLLTAISQTLAAARPTPEPSQSQKAG